jgi:hypothetical protein
MALDRSHARTHACATASRKWENRAQPSLGPILEAGSAMPCRRRKSHKLAALASTAVLEGFRHRQTKGQSWEVCQGLRRGQRWRLRQVP